MSSEESEIEEEDDGSKTVSFVIYQIPWHYDKITELFLSLDHKHTKKQSVKSTQMTPRQLQGNDSNREIPDEIPSWCVKERYLKLWTSSNSWTVKIGIICI